MTFYDLQALLGGLLPIAMPAIGAIYTWWATERATARKAVNDLKSRLDAVDLQLAAAGHNASALLAMDERMDALRDRVDQHGSRLQALEQTVMQLPDKDMFHQLDKGQTEQAGAIRALAESVKSIATTASRIEQFLLEEAKKR